MVRNLWHDKFSAGDSFVARRDMGDLKAGQPVSKDAFTERRLRQLYDQRVIVKAEVWASIAGPIGIVEHSEIDALRDEAESLGIKVDGRWSIARLKEEINGKSA